MIGGSPFRRFVIDIKSTTEISEIVKNYAQVAAWLVGALYFVVKLVQGYLVVDMSVTVVPTRQASSSVDTDYLVASVTLNKGERASFRLHDAKIVVGQGETRQESKLDFQRFSFRRDKKLLSINFEKPSARVPTLNLAPGESANVATWFTVSSAEPCLVEVVVIGTGFSSLVVGQWRASAVSLPLIKSGV